MRLQLRRGRNGLRTACGIVVFRVRHAIAIAVRPAVVAAIGEDVDLLRRQVLVVRGKVVPLVLRRPERPRGRLDREPDRVSQPGGIHPLPRSVLVEPQHCRSIGSTARRTGCTSSRPRRTSRCRHRRRSCASSARRRRNTGSRRRGFPSRAHPRRARRARHRPSPPRRAHPCERRGRAAARAPSRRRRCCPPHRRCSRRGGARCAPCRAGSRTPRHPARGP